jgi:hypothetical protein
LAKCTQSAREQLGRRTAEKTDHRHHLLRGRYKRPRCGTAEKCNELASAHYNARGQSQGIVGYKKQPTEKESLMSALDQKQTFAALFNNLVSSRKK